MTATSDYVEVDPETACYPTYVSHRAVQAFKISQVLAVFDGGADLVPVQLQDPKRPPLPPRRVGAEYVYRGNPTAGNYWVRYPDGYETCLSEDTFKLGNWGIAPDVKQDK